MDDLPDSWKDLSHQWSLGDTNQEAIPPLDTNMQMALWIPLYPPQSSIAPVLFQRATTAPIQVCMDHFVEMKYTTASLTNL